MNKKLSSQREQHGPAPLRQGMTVALSLIFMLLGGIGNAAPATGHALNAPFQHFIDQLYASGKLDLEEGVTFILHDLATDTRQITMNADRPRQAASMIKPFVALSFFHKVKDGTFIYGKMSKEKLRLMLRKSDNAATNWFMRLMGGPAGVQAILNAHYPTLAAGISIVEYIPSNGRTYRNKVVGETYVTFLKALWKEAFPHSPEMKEAMRFQSWFPEGGRATSIKKNGYTAMVCGVMDLIAFEAPNKKGGPFIFIGIIERGARAADYIRWRDARLFLLREIESFALEMAIRSRRAHPAGNPDRERHNTTAFSPEDTTPKSRTTTMNDRAEGGFTRMTMEDTELLLQRIRESLSLQGTS